MVSVTLWLLSVQLVADGPVYRFPVADCTGFSAYITALEAWATRSHLPPPVATCGPWDAPPQD